MDAQYLTGPVWGLLMLALIIGAAAFAYLRVGKVRREVDEAIREVKGDVDRKVEEIRRRVDDGR